MTLLTEATREILERGNYTKERTNIPNNHPAVKAEVERLTTITQMLGIDFEATGFTFTAAKNVKGLSFYSPYVGASKGKAVINWGNVQKPLDELEVPKSIEEDGKRLLLEVECGDELVRFSLMLPKDSTVDKATLRKALRNGTLGELLSEGFQKPQSLAELLPGIYKVTEYRQNVFNGDIKYNIMIDGQGWFKANTKLARKLAKNPTITTEQPAELLVEESFETTSTGYAIIPVDLTTLEDTKIPVYDF